MDILNRPADEFGNDQMLEELWAQKAFEHADIYSNLLGSADPRNLRLTQFDNEIYTAFRQDFPTLDIRYIDENKFKNTETKAKWRTFIEKFNKLDDFNFGTLLRTDADQLFGPSNSMLVTRIQFWAIEIARNREGVNDKFGKLYREFLMNNKDSGSDELSCGDGEVVTTKTDSL